MSKPIRYSLARAAGRQDWTMIDQFGVVLDFLDSIDSLALRCQFQDHLMKVMAGENAQDLASDANKKGN